MDIFRDRTDILRNAVSPFLEMGAYEAMWTENKASFKTLAELFADKRDSLPSDIVGLDRAREFANKAHTMLGQSDVHNYGVRIHGTSLYPQRLRDAAHPLEVFYFQGDWELVDFVKSVAVVGTRNPTEDGKKRARELVKSLVRDGFAVVSGLAQGIDTIVHETTLAEGGKTIAVLGTPLTRAYPKSNKKLQQKIAAEHLLISQVPVIRYEQVAQITANQHFFPSRNVTMSAFTDATIIVEAGETSGTMVQARAALKQKRKLFILDNCFHRGYSWPENYLRKGAIRVKDYSDISNEFPKQTIN